MHSLLPLTEEKFFASLHDDTTSLTGSAPGRDSGFDACIQEIPVRGL